MFDQFGKLLMTFGLLFLVLGGIVTLLSRLGNIGRLPGDILFQRGNMTFFFPLTTSIIISIVLSLLFTFLTKR